jgi:hypothetical protein
VSVLIEAVSLVVRRAALDVRYPGGMHGFLHDLRAPKHRAHRTCVDSHLVSVSFLLPHHATLVANSLTAHGLMHIDDDRCIEFAIVEHACRPKMSCEWLEWQQHPDGYTHAWPASTDPGNLSAPEGWDLEHARLPKRAEIGEESRGCVLIALEGGIETWLDFETGEIATKRGSHREDEATVPAPAAAPATAPLEAPASSEPLMPVVLAALIGADVPFRHVSETAVCLPSHDPKGFYWFQIVVDEESRTIAYRCTLGTHVPQHQLGAVTELLTRLTTPSTALELDIDLENGWVSVRTHSCIERPTYTTADVMTTCFGLRDVAAQHHDAVMRVAFGGMSPFECSSDSNSPEQL